MSKAKIVLIGIAGTVMAGAVVFFVLIVKHPAPGNQYGGGSLPAAPPFSLSGGGAPPTPPSASRESPAPSGLLSSAFLPAPDLRPQAFTEAPPNQAPSSVSLGAREETAIGQLGSQLGLRDQYGKLLSPQQIIQQSSGLPMKLQALLEKPGGPTVADIVSVEQQNQTQYSALKQEMDQFNNSNASPVDPSTIVACNKIVTGFTSYVNAWGSAGFLSTLGQLSGGCALPQFPFGLPSVQ